MKRFSCLMALILTVILTFSMAVPAFAADALSEKAGEYTFEVKTDKTEVKAGDTLKISVFVYGSTNSFGITSNKNSKLIYGFSLPKELIDVSSSIDDGYTKEYPVTNYDTDFVNPQGTVTVTSVIDLAEDLNIYKNRKTDVIEFSKDKPIATYTFYIAKDVAAGNYTIKVNAANIAACDGSTNAEMKAPVAKNAEIAVKGKEATKYTVTFDTDGGSAINSQQVEEGKFATVPATAPTKGGYTFKHWSLTADGAAYDFDTPVAADITLYAVFEKNPAPVFTGSMDRTNITVDGKEYTNVLVGKYSITPDGKKWIGCEFYPDTEGWTGTKGALGFKEGFEFEGGATVEFSTAIVGVPAGTGIVIAPVYAD